MDLLITQRTAGWITAALITCQSLCGQTGTRTAPEFREDTPPTVTFQELRHRVPREAQAEIEKAARARQKHQPEQEIEHLKKAVLIDPEYIAARNNLGVCLLLNEPAAAIVQMEAAIKVNPNQGILFANLGVGYVLIGNLEEAERAARMAMKLDGTSNQARALLGLVLAEEHKYTEEAATFLERASQSYAVAHVYAAKVLIERREFLKARSHLDSYLYSSDTEHRKDPSEMLDFIDRRSPARESWPDQF